MRAIIIMSQEPLTMYIFHPMLSSPIGITNTNTQLRKHQQLHGTTSIAPLTYANAFNANCENASPFARIE